MFKRNIYYFFSVVEEGSFSAAAKKHFLSQSAISQQIDELEKELQVKLFDRTHYRPKVTRAGQHYYDECISLLNHYQFTLNETRRLSTQKIIQLGIVGSFERKHLPLILEQLRAKYPDSYAHINVKKYNYGEVVQALENHDIDIAFGASNDFKDKVLLKTEKLYHYHICAVCSTQHPWASKQSITPEDIQNEAIISFSKNLGVHLYKDFLNAFKQDSVQPNIIKETNDFDEMLLSVKLNQGVCFTCRELIEDTSDLIILDFEHTHHYSDFCLGYCQTPLNKFTKEFVTLCKQYFNSLTL